MPELMYFVVIADVRSAVRQLRSEAETVKQHLDNISASLDDASPGAWTSPAASTFSELKPDLTKANSDMVAAIGAIADRMDWAMDNYHTTETANYYTFSGGTT